MRPVELALQVIEVLSIHQPAGVTELAALCGLPKSTAQRTLQALHKAGWIEARDPDRPLWTLTMRAVLAASRATQDQLSLRSLALPVMEDLRRATEETVHLTYRFERNLVLLERLDGFRPVRWFFAYGTVTALHATASGKAILACLSEAELDDYLERRLSPRTPATITDPDALRADLKTVRAQGYAVTFGSNVADVNAVGAAILGARGQPLAALSVSTPAERMNADVAARYGPLVADAARRVGLGAAAHPGAGSRVA